MVVQSVIDHLLEGGGGVREAGWHYLMLEMAEKAAEPGFPLLSFRHLYQVVHSPTIQLGVLLGLGKLHQQLLSKSEEVLDLDSDFLDPPIVHT